MSEQQVQTPVQDAPKPTETVATNPINVDPFSEESWRESGAKPEEKPVEEPVKTGEPEPKEDVFDETVYLKEHFGLDSRDAIKEKWQKLQELEQAAQTREEIKFVNEQSQKFFEAFKEGKEDEIYNHLHEKKRIERIEKMDISKASDAADIIKMNLLYKNKAQGIELTSDEIDYLFNKDFQMPPKPVQTDDMLDEDYELAVANWKQAVEMKERGMIIEAKLAKPEILKYKNELVLPDLPKAEAAAFQPTPEELAKMEQARNAFLTGITKGLHDLKGFNAAYKDEEVELPISYDISENEKAALKPIMESFVEGYGYFDKRWTNPDGSINTTLMSEDLYLLENKPKVFQKFANESGAQVKEYRMKQKSNIQLNTDAHRTAPTDEKSHLERQVQAIWDA